MQNQERVGGLHLVSDNTVAFIDADYQEFAPDTFKGYTVRVGESGEPSEHFETTAKAAEFARSKGAETIYLLSSCDNLEADRKRSV